MVFIIKKFIGALVPFFLFHIVCCGALLFFLISSGWLLAIRQEGVNKLLLIPLLVSGVGLLGLHIYYGRCCKKAGKKSSGDHIFMTVLYIAFSITFGLVIMVYLFIPWWIPNYKGGPLLP